MDFAISYSFGKDSALALYRMVRAGHRPVALLTTFNPEHGRSWIHGMQPDLMHTVAESLGIPLILCPCEPDTYAGALENGIAQARALGAKACVFGDIDLDHHAEFDRERCAAAGVACELPLWWADREDVLRECLDAGFKPMIKLVDAKVLDESFLGQTLTMPLARRMAESGADICGENGEYHTFVYDGPLFKHPVAIHNHGTVDLGRHKAADLRLL